jgi:hypothetical protein
MSVTKHFGGGAMEVILRQNYIGDQYFIIEIEDQRLESNVSRLETLIKELQRAQAWLKEQEKKKEPVISEDWEMLHNHCKYVLARRSEVEFGTKCPLPENEFWKFCAHYGYDGQCYETMPAQWGIKKGDSAP